MHLSVNLRPFNFLLHGSPAENKEPRVKWDDPKIVLWRTEAK